MEKGDVAFLHTCLASHNKYKTGLRCIIKLVIENFSFFNNLNDKSNKGQAYLKKNNAIKIDFI